MRSVEIFERKLSKKLPTRMLFQGLRLRFELGFGLDLGLVLQQEFVIGLDLSEN